MAESVAAATPTRLRDQHAPPSPGREPEPVRGCGAAADHGAPVTGAPASGALAHRAILHLERLDIDHRVHAQRHRRHHRGHHLVEAVATLEPGPGA